MTPSLPLCPPLPCSEYMEQHSVARLIGAPPGYIGHDEGGQLTEAVRRKPFSVVLLDEIEKAHRNVLTTFLQVLDDGRLTDSQGRVVDFTNTIVIMTSNIGAQYILKDAEERGAERAAKRARLDGAIGGASASAAAAAAAASATSASSDVDLTTGSEYGPSTSHLKPETVAKVMALVKTHFLPEFLNRCDDVILFAPLSVVNLRAIVRHQMRDLVKRLEDRDIEVRVTDAALDQILREAYNPAFGARPIRRYVEKHIATALSRMIISGTLYDHAAVDITPGAGEAEYRYAVSRKLAVGPGSAGSAAAAGSAGKA